MADPQRGFNIASFRAAISEKRVAKPNLFHVEFNLPRGLTGTGKTERDSRTVRTLEYWCEATGLPGTNIQTYQAQRYGYGHVQRRPLITAYGEAMFDFIFDADGDNHTFFYNWMNMTVNSDLSEGVNTDSNEVNLNGNGLIVTQPFELTYRDDYCVDISVYLYDATGVIIKQLTLREAFPVAVGDARLAWSDNNTYLRLVTQIAYTDWFVQSVNQGEVTSAAPEDYYNLSE